MDFRIDWTGGRTEQFASRSAAEARIAELSDSGGWAEIEQWDGEYWTAVEHYEL